MILFHALLDEPDIFEPGVAELLQELIHKMRSWEDLRSEEQELLNRAAVDFATAKRPKAQEPPKQPEKRVDSPAVRAACGDLSPDLEYREHSRPVQTLDIPEEPQTFWWRKK